MRRRCSVLLRHPPQGAAEVLIAPAAGCVRARVLLCVCALRPCVRAFGESLFVVYGVCGLSRASPAHDQRSGHISVVEEQFSRRPNDGFTTVET